LKRRCLYHWLDYPSAERERAILKARVPEVDDILNETIVSFVQKLRGMELFKPPGLAETLDWARALTELNLREIDRTTLESTMGVLLKYQDDIARVRSIWEDQRTAAQ
jgi:MoxR-like ATPase